VVLIPNEKSPKPLRASLGTKFIRDSDIAITPPDTEMGKIRLPAIGKNLIRGSVSRKGRSREAID
jgi:hypothetical protein